MCPCLKTIGSAELAVSCTGITDEVTSIMFSCHASGYDNLVFHQVLRNGIHSEFILNNLNQKLCFPIEGSCIMD